MTHYPSTSSLSHRPPSLLNSYFKLRTQRLEICKSFWKGHSINWASGNFLLLFLCSVLLFSVPIRKVLWRQVQAAPAQISSQLSSRFSWDAQPCSVWDSVTWLQQMGLLQFSSQQCSHCCYWNFSSCLSPVLIMCRLIPWFWWLCFSINTRHLWASSKKRIISYFWFALLTCLSLHHTLQLNIFVNWGILSIL